MKKCNILILIVIFSLGHLGCSDDILDVNDDPLVASSANADLIFPTVLVNLSNNRTIEISGTTGSILQYYEPIFSVIGASALGQIGSFTTGNTWGNYYITVLKNLVLIENDASAAEPPNSNIVAQSQILQAFIYYLLTGLWEEVPFTEALKPEFSTPQFDRQEIILRGIVNMTDNALGLIDKSEDAFRVENGDLIYYGNMNNWERFANSLKLKALMILANKDAGVASEIAAVLDQPLIDALIYEAELKYYDNPGDYNPIWGLLNNFAGGTNPEWYMGSSTFQTILQDLNDPRLATFYDESDEPEVLGTGDFFPGASPGSYGGDAPQHSIVSYNILRPDFPDRYMIAPEIVLLQAEAMARGLAPGGLAAADEKYRLAIQLSMDYFDGKPGEIDPVLKTDYLTSLPPLTSLSEADAVTAIQMQIYIADFMRMPEGWIQWRRTKVPKLVTPQGSLLSDITRRFPYPPDEKGANPNAPGDKPLDTPMWYEN